MEYETRKRQEKGGIRMSQSMISELAELAEPAGLGPIQVLAEE